MSRSRQIPLGFEVGTGARVEIPLAHTFVTGQTQLSGKTTTLRAIVERSGQRALAFVTKRGESFDGRRIRPYLPREGEKPIHWRLVETILASALGQRSMKYERLWLINAVKKPAVATTLTMVRGNVAALLAKAKGNSADVYTLIGEYLDLVLPDMRALNASDRLELQPGLNVMDLVGVSQQLQALVIRASLEHINHHEEGVLTVFPEAWEFAPRAAAAPAKEEAIAMARKGAVLGNFLLCDSQDIAGVDTVVRQAASVWILGVQRELNELKRTIQMIPAGIKRPKPEDVATLELGQFYACWGRHAVKTYVQPAWMDAVIAERIARGSVTVDQAQRHYQSIRTDAERVVRRFGVPKEEESVNEREAQALRDENAQLRSDNAELRRRLEALERSAVQRDVRRGHAGSEEAAHSEPTAGAAERRRPSGAGADNARSSGTRSGSPVQFGEDSEALYQAIKARLIEELPSDARVMEIVLAQPELRVKVQRHVLEVDGDSLRGRIALLLSRDFFDEPKGAGAVIAELQRRGAGPDVKFNTSKELAALASMGFLYRQGTTRDTTYQAVPEMKVNIVELAD